MMKFRLVVLVFCSISIIIFWEIIRLMVIVSSGFSLSMWCRVGLCMFGVLFI